ncbi:MAG: hypothetical protein MR675_05055 [Lachnospira sp.]|nr:hypothetical protein [Lachnospira sp.]
MKKKIVCVAGFLILAAVATTFIIRVNKKYAYLGVQQEYSLGEKTELQNLAVTVNDFEILQEDDFVEKYNITKRDMRSQQAAFGDEEIDSYILVVKCTFKITGEVKNFPYEDIGVASGGFKQGVSNEYIRMINDKNNLSFSKLEKGSTVDINMPFIIISKRFPYKISIDKLNKENWKLYLSVTPAKYVKLKK